MGGSRLAGLGFAEECPFYFQCRAGAQGALSLNTKQKLHDRLLGELRGQQHTLLYWAQLADLTAQGEPAPWQFNGQAKERLAKATSQLRSTVNITRNSLNTTREGLPTTDADTGPDEGKLHEILRGRCVSAPRPPYHRTADPVVLVLGTKPGTAGSATTIRCRLRSELPPPQDAPKWITALPEDLLPALTEFTQLDTTGESKATVPPFYGAAAWKQPWQPLFVEWELDYTPVPAHDADGTPTTHWEFTGNDYRWKKTGAHTGARTTLKGRQVLGPHLSRTLHANIQHYLSTHPALPPKTVILLKSLSKVVTDLDPLSQTLAGLTDQLAGRLPLAGTPLTTTGEALDRLPSHNLTPGPLPDIGETWPPSRFQDVRAGHLVFTALTVIDVFGRTLDVIDDTTRDWTPLLLAPDMRPDKTPVASGYDRTIEARPRLVQPARLAIELSGAANDDLDYERDCHNPGANPLCGWILPNYLDGSLLCFDPDGAPLIQLRPAANNTIAALPLPGFDHDDITPVTALRSRHIKALIKAASSANGAFQALNTAIHRLLPDIDTGHPDGTHQHTALTGRPLALIRAAASIQTNGPLWTDPAWQQVHTDVKNLLDPPKEPPAPAPARPWTVRLGETKRLHDGLIGFYTYTDPAAFPSLTPTSPTSTLHLAPGAKPVMVTLLMDPHAVVHAASGILPVHELRLPDHLTRTPLSRLRMSHRVGPLPATERDKRLVLPTPPATTGTWTFAHTHTTNHDWTYTPLIPADTTTRLPDGPLALHTGYLHCTTPQETQT
ncbi:hypothetical protein [Streptomyces zagrosensis]|uniref:Uncharacterized protein n=1 Tax=Streptomyces zagrosensis TaxID=1042984 RepID=A0A7W9QE57_9ACTN|nr:hypothetical protein [Streptomyces zagrosensis]MBB5938633.1 hypothetical protein [Streptomyces zagrosensis]